jgi:predicted DNA-binding transcriptional regulator AlpA
MTKTLTRYLHLISSEEAAAILGMTKKKFYRTIKGQKEILPYVVLPQLKSTDIKYRYNDVVELKKKINDGSFDLLSGRKRTDLVNIENAADMLGISKPTFYIWRSKGKIDLKTYKHNGLIHYKISEILEYINKHVVK